jgi:hypothetical protein
MSLRPRLAVIAQSMADAVLAAGGWVFDQVMVGWDAIVLTPDYADAGAALILGARACDLKAVLVSAAPGAGLQGVAVHADLYDHVPRVRRLVLDVLHTGRAEVMFWGQHRSPELDDAAQQSRHQLSTAARAFKAQALAALPASVAGVDPARVSQGDEVFFRVQLRQPSPIGLVPVVS